MDLAATFSVKKVAGLTSGAIVNFYRGTNLDMYVDKQEWQKLCDSTQDRLINNESFCSQVKQGMIRECKILKIFSDKLLKSKPQELSDQQLIKYYEDYEKSSRFCY